MQNQMEILQTLIYDSPVKYGFHIICWIKPTPPAGDMPKRVRQLSPGLTLDREAGQIEHPWHTLVAWAASVHQGLMNAGYIQTQIISNHLTSYQIISNHLTWFCFLLTFECQVPFTSNEIAIPLNTENFKIIRYQCRGKRYAYSIYRIWRKIFPSQVLGLMHVQFI